MKYTEFISLLAQQFASLFRKAGFKHLTNKIIAMNRSTLLIFIIYLSVIQAINAQITEKSELISEQKVNLKQYKDIPLYTMPVFDIHQAIGEDRVDASVQNKPFCFAKVFDTEIDVKKEGLVESLAGEGKLWRLRILSSGAYSLNVIFGIFELPDGAELNIYNKDKTHLHKLLTAKDNNPSKIIPTHPIEGDEIVFEYFEPSNASFPGNLVITKVGHDYVGILGNGDFYDGYYGGSEPCNVDINCYSTWQNEKQSVVRIMFGAGYTGSGSLINNSNNDGIPYVLTAAHMINTSYYASTAVFIFNYESPTCNGGDGSTSQYMNGSTLRATWGTYNRPLSDFTLLELYSNPPSNYEPYWNGWDKGFHTPSTPVTCIHHPAGYVKKISVEYQTPTHDEYMWYITDWTIGTVEPGSSGAPLYNSNHQVIGQVSQGNNIFCSPYEQSWYGRLSRSWEGGGSSSSRLMDWLDPSHQANTLPGLRYVLNHYYDSGEIIIVSGDIVRFSNVHIEDDTDIIVDYSDSFKIDGPFEVEIGSTLITITL